MSLRITKIRIQNFRSIRDLSIETNYLAVLVGKNDSGKSNVLRALNLFFNDETNPGEELDFDTDHNVFNQPNRQAKEIVITLEIELPEGYQATNGDFIVWKKKWRHTGLVDSNDYTGYRRPKSNSRTKKPKPVKVPGYSKLPALLFNINFTYVPAIRDMKYFSELRAKIYETIAEVAGQEFRKSSQSFEASIADQLGDLTTEITSSLGLRSNLALPKDLSHIFESLDFLSEGENISLDARGDGIKARHIPLILKFMADKRQSLQVQGRQPHTSIWAYEEPENSLELASSVKLADQFWRFLSDGIEQIILTTHSPVFYNLYQKPQDGEKWISCHHMFQESDEEGTKGAIEPDDLDKRMGTMKLFAPLAEKLEDRVRQEEQARVEAEKLAKVKRRKLFVEGPSDKLIIEKALKVFASDKASEIDVETNENGGGHNYVMDMLNGWRSWLPHYPKLPRAAGIVDQDARCVANNWNKLCQNPRHPKCFLLPVPRHIQPALHASFRIPVVLETLYDKAAWEEAEQKGYLTDRSDLSAVTPCDLSNLMMNTKENLDNYLEDDWGIFVKKVFRNNKKVQMARHFSRKVDAEFRGQFGCLEPLITEIVQYLFPDG